MIIYSAHESGGCLDSTSSHSGSVMRCRHLVAGIGFISKASSHTCLTSGLGRLQMLGLGEWGPLGRLSHSMWSLHMVAFRETDFLQGS